MSAEIPEQLVPGPFRLNWGAPGSRLYETGIDRGVLYIDGVGYPWTGLTAVNEAPEGGEARSYYVDGQKYYNGSSREEFKATVEAYTYPDEFMACDGTAPMLKGMYITQQARKSFDFCYRTKIGNDSAGLNHGYKLHLVYNAVASPTAKNYRTLGDSSEPSTFSWALTTRNERFDTTNTGVRFGSHVIIDSRTTYPWALQMLEDHLYGKFGANGSVARMPTPEELIQIFVDSSLLKITDNGDGTWTAEGSDEIVSMISSNKFQIDWPSAEFLINSNTTYTVSNL